MILGCHSREVTGGSDAAISVGNCGMSNSESLQSHLLLSHLSSIAVRTCPECDTIATQLSGTVPYMVAVCMGCTHPGNPESGNQTHASYEAGATKLRGQPPMSSRN